MTAKDIKDAIASNVPPHNVLIVEDNQPYAKLLCALLSQIPEVECTVCYSPRMALLQDVKKFSIAFVDWNFPGEMTGIEFGQILKDERPDMRIIIHTGFTDITITKQCRLLGFEMIPKV